jgi:hypothetical protein
MSNGSIVIHLAAAPELNFRVGRSRDEMLGAERSSGKAKVYITTSSLPLHQEAQRTSRGGVLEIYCGEVAGRHLVRVTFAFVKHIRESPPVP